MNDSQMTWTEEDANAFVRYVAKYGGTVTRQTFWPDGTYTFDIVPPNGAQPGWSQAIMKRFVETYERQSA